MALYPLAGIRLDALECEIVARPCRDSEEVQGPRSLNPPLILRKPSLSISPPLSSFSSHIQVPYPFNPGVESRQGALPLDLPIEP